MAPSCVCLANWSILTAMTVERKRGTSLTNYAWIAIQSLAGPVELKARRTLVITH